MDYRQLSNLLIKISGVVIIVFVVTGIPGHINSFYYQGQETLAKFAVLVIFPLMFPFIIGLMMWFFPGTMTNKMLDKSIDSAPSKGAFEEFERIAITVLGVTLLFFALSDLTFNLAFVYVTHMQNAGVITAFSISAQDWGHILGTLVEIMFALILLLKAKGVMLLLKRMRS